MIRQWFLVGALFVASALLPRAAGAQTVSPVSPSAFEATERVDWQVMGPARTPLGQSFNAVTDQGLGVTVTLSNGATLQRLNQYNAAAGVSTWGATGWNGNFTPGEALLWTGSTAGPLVFDFAAPVAGTGLQIQANRFGSFSGTLQVFGSDGSLLGETTGSGTSNWAADGSALFLGLTGSHDVIRRAVFTIESDNVGRGFAVNALQVRVAPEPASAMLLLAGGTPIGLLAFRRRPPVSRHC